MAHVDTPRRRRFAWLIRGNSLEVTAAALLLAGTVAGSLEVPLAPSAIGLSVAICVLVGLSGRWPVPIGLSIGALCLVLAIAMPEEESLALYGCLAPLVTCGAAGLTVARRWFTAFASVLIFTQTVGRIPAHPDLETLAPVLASHAVFVLAVVTMAWAAGGAFQLLLRQQRQEADGTLRALRRQIARDLHDGVAGTLSVIAIRAEQGRRQGGATVEDLAFIAEKSREAIADLRSVLTLLRRDQPEGTQFAIDWRVRPLTEVIDTEAEGLNEAGFPLAVTVEGDSDSLSRSVADVMGRVLHEAASNVRRHSAQGECVLLVSITAEQVELALINPLRTTTQSSHEPLGLLGMRERVETLGGSFEAGAVGPHWILRAAIPTLDSQSRTWR